MKAAREKHYKMGSVELVFGPMFSGKTSLMLSKTKEYLAASAAGRVVLVKHDVDVRREGITTHDGQIFVECERSKIVNTKKLADLSLSGATFVGVDEGQFFPDLADVCAKWAQAGVRVVVAALSGDASCKPYSTVSRLVAVSDVVTHLAATCRCGAPAPFTARLDHRLCSITDIGGGDKYEPVCRADHPQFGGDLGAQNTPLLVHKPPESPASAARPANLPCAVTKKVALLEWLEAARKVYARAVGLAAKAPIDIAALEAELNAARPPLLQASAATLVALLADNDRVAETLAGAFPELLLACSDADMGKHAAIALNVASQLYVNRSAEGVYFLRGRPQASHIEHERRAPGQTGEQHERRDRISRSGAHDQRPAGSPKNGRHRGRASDYTPGRASDYTPGHHPPPSRSAQKRRGAAGFNTGAMHAVLHTIDEHAAGAAYPQDSAALAASPPKRTYEAAPYVPVVNWADCD